MRSNLSKKLDLSFNEMMEKTVISLNDEGFIILSEIDLKKPNNTENTKNYRILNIYNNEIASKSQYHEEEISMIMPFNIVVQELSKSSAEVSALDPLHSLAEVDNIKLRVLAWELGQKLKKVINNIELNKGELI
ncbi:hypothetical protein BH10BAC5_BH10BAC5_26120 [soil metagenome]